MRYFYALLLTFFSFQFISQTPNYVPSNGLVGWWPFTGNANDLSGNNNNGTVNGATLTTDRFGVANRAYSFNGNDWIEINNNLNHNVGAGSFTLSCWAMKTGNNTFQHLITRNQATTNQDALSSYNLRYDNNNTILFPGSSSAPLSLNNGGCISNQINNLNNWNYFVAVFNAPLATYSIYQNGGLISVCNVAPNFYSINNNGKIYFGVENPTANFVSGPLFLSGKIDDIGIWNRALSQQEISALYTSTAGTVASLNCNGYTQSGNLYSGQAASNVSVSVPYTGGNGGYYAGQNVTSTGVTGLTATLTSGTLANGSGTLSYTITGTPSGVGNATFAVNLGGQSCNLVVPITALSGQYPANSVFCANGPTAIVDVTNPTTGKTWMDRNLGASQVATSSTDQNAYGDLYQWGRRADGHQCRTSPTTATLSSVDQPAHGNFIVSPNQPHEWRSPQNVNLWQGVNGVNNPCPSGYRIPTETEINAERLSWSTNTSVGALVSFPKN